MNGWRSHRRRAGVLWGTLLISWVVTVWAASSSPGPVEQAAVQRLATDLALELKQACPVSDAANQKSFEVCRQALFKDSLFKRALPAHLLWGRQAADPATSLKESSLTQLAPDVYAGLYLPIFMFDGSAEVSWVEREKMYRIQLGATVRNRLPPGLFPYPFWHDPAKWSAYENANALILWVSPTAKPEIRVAQFSWQDGPLKGVEVQRAATPKFDGQWLWKDSAGKTQPAVTLFDGLYSERNPHKAELDLRFRELATSLREGQCLDCHVPSNPQGLRRLVLLQTPAHAAGEIGRILKTVRSQRMPVDELGVETALPEGVKQALIKKGEAFENTVLAAKRWEAEQAPAAALPAKP